MIKQVLSPVGGSGLLPVWLFRRKGVILVSGAVEIQGKGSPYPPQRLTNIHLRGVPQR